MSDYTWHKFDKNNPPKQLIDHYYYLVTHTYFGTPMKAKWHEEMGGLWEIFIGNGKPNEYVYCFNETCPISAWMQLPAKYSYEEG